MLTQEQYTRNLPRSNRIHKSLYASFLREGRPIRIPVKGMSMYPFIKNQDLLKIEPLREGIKVGDIVAVEISTPILPRFYIHRVVKIQKKKEGKRYITKGDYFAYGCDRPVVLECILGKVVEIVRKGNIRISLQSLAWRFLSAGIARISLYLPRILSVVLACIDISVERSFLFARIRSRLFKASARRQNAIELLLFCVQKGITDNARRKAIIVVEQGVDWEYLSDLIVRERAAVVAYQGLKVLEPFLLDNHQACVFISTLREAYCHLVRKAFLQHKATGQLLKLFSDSGIPVVPLKGTQLSEFLYGDVAARGISVDVDLLVKEEDRLKAQHILEFQGYQLECAESVPEWQWQCTFFKQGAFMVDLHWDITMMNRSSKRIEGFWKAARYIEADGYGYYALSEEDLLLYLSAHLASSICFQQLRYVCDMRALLDAHAEMLNWDFLIEKAKQWQLSSSLFASLKITKRFFNVNIPDYVFQRLKPGIVASVLIKIFVCKKIVVQDCFRKRIIRGFLSYIFLELIEAESVRAIISCFCRVILPPDEIVGNRNRIRRFIKGFSKFFLTK